jgi:hypothetical protein
MAAKDAKTNLSLAESSAMMAKASKEDSAVMRTIAIKSKKDSSAMKTIAILGMFFLPGTFVAVSAFPFSVLGHKFNWFFTRQYSPCPSSTGMITASLPSRQGLDIIGQLPFR